MRNHIDLSAARYAPVEILRALRAVDPAYDIHYLGDGRWVVGRVAPNIDRRLMGAKMKKHILRNPNLPRYFSRLRVAELAMEGLGIVEIYKFKGEPTDQIVQDVRQREYTHQKDRELAFRKALDAADVRPDMPENVYDDIEYRERHVAPQLFRNAKSFTRGASNGDV
jgi:hypothetical protein